MKTTLHLHFRRLAQFDIWANEALYKACESLTSREAGAGVIRMVYDELNRALAVDRLWLARLRGYDSGLRALDERLYDDFGDLQAARTAEDVLLYDFVHALSDEELERAIPYRGLDGEQHANSEQEILTHLFDQQTLHRGRVHTLLSQTRVTPPTFDFLAFLSRE